MLAFFRTCVFLFVATAVVGQDVKLIKTTLSSSASSTAVRGVGSVSINYTIGQSTNINHFSAGQLRLLQGFQHPFLFSCAACDFRSVTVSIYPNPSQGIISIRWHNDVADDVVWVYVIDMHGKIVVKILLHRKGQEVQFDASALPKATYVLQLRSTKGDYATHKLILI